MKKNMCRVLVVVLIMMLLTPVGVFAVSKRPYEDVSKDECGKAYTTAINEYARHGDLKKVVKGNKFYPFKVATHKFVVKALQRSLKKRYGHTNVIPPKYLNESGSALSIHDWEEQFLVDVASYGYGEEIMYPKERTRRKIAKLEKKKPTPERNKELKRLKKKLRELKKRGRQTEDRGCTICELANWEAFMDLKNCTPIHH